MKSYLRLPVALVAAVFLVVAPKPVSAQPPEPLSPFITTATRTPAAPQTIGTATDRLSSAELARRQVTSLSGALSLTGAPLFASGASGAATSLFLRGANSNQVQFLVDGLRANDANTEYQVFLGGSCVSACDSLEIAHGPQSTLYGGEAIGGVISLRAERGQGGPSGRVAVEAGSFGTLQGVVAAQGERGRTAWNVSLQGGHTDNDRVNNAFDSANAVVRLDRTVSERLKVGGTARWFHAVYGSPGTRFTNDPDNEEREDNVLATAFGELKLAEFWTARGVLGGQDRRYVSHNPRAGGPTQITVVKNRRAVFDGQTTYAGWERHRLTAGVTTEANHTRNTGFGAINHKQGLVAVFAQDEFAARDDLHLSAGFRNDDFDTFGRATTGRATAAWLVANRALKLRSSYGTAFRSPSFLDLYGRSAFYVGNPNLEAERARGWDAGLDWYALKDRGVVSLTWFDTRFTNLIASTPDFRSVENIQRARTRGAEASVDLRFPATHVRVSYTYLEAENLTVPARLLRRPRQRYAVDAWHAFGTTFNLGVGVAGAVQREDVHARTFARIDGEDYAVTRLYGSWALSPQLAIKARVENLFNERYEEVHGYPAIGFGAYGGVEWKF